MEEFKFSKDDLRLQLKITDCLIRLGVPVHILGFEYLREAISLVICDRSYIQSLTTRLYPEIAKKFDSTPSRVERAMRHAVEVAFDRGDPEIISNYFSYSINKNKGKATNGEFIATVADRLKMEIQIDSLHF